jgi:serine/threonine protein kinase/tetratricopeptide (TPR) repeat protein
LLQPGERFAGRFLIESLAGQGGMGAVFRALDLERQETVALKILNAQGPFEERFLRESEILAALHHPGIVRYVAHGRASRGEPFLAMEWLDGEDLSDFLETHALAPQESVGLISRVADALGAAHERGIIHRDLKPSNLFLPRGQLHEVKLLDFGIAFQGGAPRAMTQVGAILGTPGYMAPEQARGQREIGPYTDVYSLGCILFECITGRPAFLGDNLLALLAKILVEDPPRPREIRQDIPPSLDELCAWMMAKEYKARPKDAGEVVRALAQLSSDPGVARLPQATALTQGEQRFWCVGLIGAPDRPADQTIVTEAEQEDLRNLRSAVEPLGGRLEPVLGGSLVLTVSGGGVATDHAAQAARCALALHKLLPERPVALATGRGQDTEGGPFGEVIDRAASLLAAPGTTPGIAVDDVTAGLLGAQFAVQSNERRRYLLGERRLFDATRLLLGRQTPLVGRELEREQLLAWIRQSQSERRALAVRLRGPAGSGKSRLTHEVLRLVLEQESPPEIFFSRGDAARAGAPYGLLAPALRRACRILEREPLEQRQQKFVARLSRSFQGAVLERVGAFLGELCGVPWPGELGVQMEAARQDPALMNDQILWSLIDWLRAECQARPLVLVLEDLHFGDAPSLRLIDAALRALRKHPFLVLTTSRPEADSIFPRLWAERNPLELSLPPLSPLSIGQLVRAVIGPQPPEVLDRIVEQSAGNAFYVEEMIRAIASGAHELPETVVAMLSTRLDALPAPLRRLLRAASVFGPRFWRGGVAALLHEGNASEELDAQLDDLVAREMIEPAGDSRFAREREFFFPHAPLREAAYASLTESDRVLGHRLAAAWLFSQGENQALVMAEHHERGGETPQALAWCQRAAEQASDAGDFDASLAWIQKALSLGAEGNARGALLSMNAEICIWRGDAHGAERCADESIPFAETGSRSWIKAVGALALSRLQRGDLAGASPVAARLREISPQTCDVTTYIITSAPLVAVLFVSGAFQQAGDYLGHLETVAAGHEANAPNLRGWINLGRSARTLLQNFSPWARLLYTQDAVAAFEEAGNQRNVCLALLQYAGARCALGDFASAVELQREVLQRTDERGLFHLTTNARADLGLALSFLGEHEAARETEESAIAEFSARKNILMDGFSRASLAQIHLNAQRPTEARDAAAAALPTLQKAPAYRAYALALLSQAHRLSGETQEALERATQALELLQSLGGESYNELLIRVAYAEATHAASHPEAPAALALAQERLASYLGRIHDPTWRAVFLQHTPACVSLRALTSERSG